MAAVARKVHPQCGGCCDGRHNAQLRALSLQQRPLLNVQLNECCDGALPHPCPRQDGLQGKFWACLSPYEEEPRWRDGSATLTARTCQRQIDCLRDKVSKVTPLCRLEEYQ